jgi:hypothetical protein
VNAPSSPQGRDGELVDVRVSYAVRFAPPVQIIFLGDPHGMMLHYAHSGSTPCTWPAACKGHDKKAPKYHGFAPVLLRVSTLPEIWEHRVFDCSAGFCRRLEGRPVRGERWEVSAPQDPETGQFPVVANYLGLMEGVDLPEPCSVENTLKIVFNWRTIPPSIKNPIPAKEYLPPVSLNTGPQPEIKRPEIFAPPPAPPPAPVVDPAVQALIDQAEKLEARTRRGYNATADRLMREAAERMRLPKP